ncbi:MAG TPA: lysylphosphatidylglycerol synthase transmembrane domain-containing protein [Pirellulales bacterium]|nr:lysylphosphatidylglycerol synthase transmembrane domain-containing protein [Pirellulales bacterium]
MLDPVNKTLLNLVKFGVSIGLIAYLVADPDNREAFTALAGQPKDWGTLTLAWLACLAAVVLTFVRWYILVRALDLPFSMKDAFRLGFLGYLLNFISLGSVGGDLFKAVFIAREQPGRRAEAVATVVLDRVIGLYMLFVLASAAIVATGLWNSQLEPIRIICQGTMLTTGLGFVAILILLIPGITQGRFSSFLERLPRAGPLFGSLLGAIRLYRRRLDRLLLAGLLSLGVHSLSSLGIYLVARGLPGEVPPLADHFVIVPLAMVTGVLPLPVNGLGAFEGVVNYLYQHVPVHLAVSEGRGLAVCVGYRAITILIAMVGVGYYLASRREVVELLHQAEADEVAAQTTGRAPRGEPSNGPRGGEPAVGVP